MPTLSQLHIYPIKSAAGISLEEMDVVTRGPQHDRRWMVVDETGMLVTQRTVPALAKVKVALEDGLQLTAPGMAALELPLEVEGERLEVHVWSDPVPAVVLEEATDWFSTFLGGSYRLVYMPDETQRPMNEHPDTLLNFADGSPFHLVSEASLADLNGRLDAPVPVNRFRPNLVVSGCDAFAEDRWKAFRIGPVTFRSTGPCVRCALVTVDQATGAAGKEPLKTLARYRKVGNEVWFGGNYLHHGEGTLRLGDEVEVLED